MLNSAIFKALYFETAPPMKPVAWTKSMSLIPERFTSFYWSLIPRHSCFIPFLSSKPPYFYGTAWILHLFDLSGKMTYKISPTHSSSTSSSKIGFTQGIYFSSNTTFPLGCVYFRFKKASLTIPLVCKDPKKEPFT